MARASQTARAMAARVASRICCSTMSGFKERAMKKRLPQFMKKTMFMLTILVVGYQIVFAQQGPFESVRQLLAYDQVVSYQKNLSIWFGTVKHALVPTNSIGRP